MMSKTVIGMIVFLAVLALATFSSHPWDNIVAAMGLKMNQGLGYQPNPVTFALYAVSGAAVAWWVHRMSEA